MSRLKRAVIGFMVIANLGIYSAFGLWLVVDGGLASAASAGGDAAPSATTSPEPSATLAPTLAALAATPTPGWTPPALNLGPLPTERPHSEAQPPATQAPTETVRIVPEANSVNGPAVDAGALPPSARVLGVVGHRQALPLSCESRSAADWAAFFGVEIDELEFLAGLPVSDDPDRGFVGDVRGRWGNIPPDDYGVHAGPVAQLLRAYGLPAEAQVHMSWDRLRAEIAGGRPVIVWVTGHVELGVPVIYTASDGRRTMVAPFEHTVIVTGYDEETVLVVDGARTYRRPVEVFLASWGTLRSLAVTAGP